MHRKRVLKVGLGLASVSLATYYRQEIKEGSIGVVRFGRAAFTVSILRFNVCWFLEK